MDGARFFRSITKVVLPLALPGIMVALIFSFLLSWDKFTYALQKYIRPGYISGEIK